MVTNAARPPIFRRGMIRLVGFVRSPLDASLHVRQPPDPHELFLGPQIILPVRYNLIQRMKALGPFDIESWDCLKCNFGDYAQSSQAHQCCTKEVRVLFRGAGDCPTVRKHDFQRRHGLRQYAMPRGTAVGCCPNGACH